MSARPQSGVAAVDGLLARSRARQGLPGPHLRRLMRESARVSCNELAHALGVAPSTVSRWENGLREPRGANAERYLAALERLAATR